MASGEFLYRDALKEFQREFLAESIRGANGNMCAAARAIGVHRNTIERMMLKLEMRLADFKPQRKEPVSMSPKKKTVTVAEGCPDCGCRRARVSQMGPNKVRCHGCYKLYSVDPKRSVAA